MIEFKAFTFWILFSTIDVPPFNPEKKMFFFVKNQEVGRNILSFGGLVGTFQRNLNEGLLLFPAA